MVDYPTGRVVAGTGHRRFGADVSEIVQDWIENMLGTLQPRRVISGVALGFDTWLAEEALRQDIPLVCAVPFKGQPDRWPEPDRTRYRKLLRRADKVHIVCPGLYAPWKFQKRNEWMVNNCELLLAAWTGRLGGTANCVKYAEKVGRRIELLPGLKPEAI